MEVTITGQHLDLSNPLRERITQKIDRAASHFEHITSVHVVIHVEKSEHAAEITANIAGAQVHAHASASDMYVAIDSAADKLTAQLRKHKEKTVDHHQKEGGLKSLQEES